MDIVDSVGFGVWRKTLIICSSNALGLQLSGLLWNPGALVGQGLEAGLMCGIAVLTGTIFSLR